MTAFLWLRFLPLNTPERGVVDMWRAGRAALCVQVVNMEGSSFAQAQICKLIAYPAAALSAAQMRLVHNHCSRGLHRMDVQAASPVVVRLVFCRLHLSQRLSDSHVKSRTPCM